MKLKDKVCKNCTHFFQTGLAKSVSGNKAGYCLWIQNDKLQQERTESSIVKANPEAIKFIFDTCSNFSSIP
ncbi:MAG: hypothetical protein ACJA1D_001552 [Polaribacter sp.]|jgi:hypothetical protein